MYVLVQSPVKTTPENSRKSGHGQGSPWRVEDNPSKSESTYISRVSLHIADPEVGEEGMSSVSPRTFYGYVLLLWWWWWWWWW